MAPSSAPNLRRCLPSQRGQVGRPSHKGQSPFVAKEESRAKFKVGADYMRGVDSVETPI